MNLLSLRYVNGIEEISWDDVRVMHADLPRSDGVDDAGNNETIGLIGQRN